MAGKGSSNIEVTLEDQQNINTFGKLNNRRHELESEIAGSKKVGLSTGLALGLSGRGRGVRGSYFPA